MGMPSFLDNAIGRATHVPRQLNILPAHAKHAEGIGSIATGNKKEARSKSRTLLSPKKESPGSSLT